MSRFRPALAMLGVAAVMLGGCAAGIPRDPDGTLERVTDGTLRVGVSHNPPWTDTHTGRSPAGTEVRLVEQFAERLDADVDWTESTEATLVDALHRGELDLVIAGFADDTPWSEKAAVTRPYTESVDDQGRRRSHVMVAPMGENAFLVELERFLSAEGAR